MLNPMSGCCGMKYPGYLLREQIQRINENKFKKWQICSVRYLAV